MMPLAAFLLLLLATCGLFARDPLEDFQSDENDAGPMPILQTFKFTNNSYVAVIPENSRGKVYAVPDQRMGVYLPNPHGQVKFKIGKGDTKNFFKAEARQVGNFVYLRLRTRPSPDVSLNREHTEAFELLVTARFTQPNTKKNIETRTTVTLRIADQNDLSPLFSPTYYETTIDEDLPVFSSLLKVDATDADAGLNGDIYFSLAQRSDTFAVHQSSGVVTLIRQPSVTRTKRYELTVRAEDRGSILQKQQTAAGVFHDKDAQQHQNRTAPRVEAKVVINVQPVNLHSPVIAVEKLPELFVENAKTGRFVYAVLRVSDEDLGRHGRIKSVSVLNGDADRLFSISRSSEDEKRFNVEVSKRLAEMPHLPNSYNLTILAVDEGIPSRNSTERIEVRLLEPLIDHQPAFSRELYRFDVNETVPSLTPVGFIEMKSTGKHRLDTANLMEFSIVANRNSRHRRLPFKVNPKSGLLYVAEALDFEKETKYEFLVRAKLPNGKEYERYKIPSVEVRVEISVLDENDNTPMFNKTPSFIPIDSETEPETAIATFEASDADTEDNGFVTFSMATEEAVPFIVDARTGELKLIRPLDAKSYQLRIRASDWGSPLRRENEVGVLVEVVDNLNAGSGVIVQPNKTALELLSQTVLNPANFHAPLFAPSIPNEIRISESASVDRELYRLTCTDDDVGPSGWLRYAITEGGADSGDGKISIDPQTGGLKLLKPLDRETVSDYSLTVSCSDMGPNPRSAHKKLKVIVLDANDNPPVFTKASYSAQVTEPSEVGHKLLEVKAIDRDEGVNAQVHYSLLRGVGLTEPSSVDDTSAFEIDSTTGVVTVAKQLDRERVERYAIWVQAEDDGHPALHSLAKLTIEVLDVNDEAPKCSQKRMRVQVAEDVPIGSFISCVSATDADLGVNGMVTFSIEPQSGEIPFSIDSDTGCLWMTGSDNRRFGLDFERRQLYNLSIEVTDRGNPQFSSVCAVEVEILDVNENQFPPEFEDFAINASVYENESPGAEVVRVTAIDPDSAVTSVNEGPTYYIGGGDGLGMFSVDSNGVIRTTARLDRESKSFYWLTVVARDQAAVPLTSSVDVYVAVLDRNDNHPQPTKPIYFASVVENSPPGTLVQKISAVDPDTGGSGSLRYRISRGDPQNYFQISPTGELVTAGRLIDREKVGERELEVVITDEPDNGETPLSTAVTVVIDTLDVNDNSPQFPQKIYNFNVLESPGGGKRQFLARVFASDEDLGLNATLEYSIVEGNAENLFTIDKDSGEIFTDGQIKADETYEFTVEASDKGVPRLSNRTRVMLTGNAKPTMTKNNMPPVIPSDIPVMHVAETDDIGQKLGLIEAEDPDGDAIWFDVTGGSGKGIFSIGKDSGEVQLARKLNYATAKHYTLEFTASDGMNAADGEVIINVAQTVWSRPFFEKERYEVDVSENTKVGSVVARPRAFTNESKLLGSTPALTYTLFATLSTESAKKFKVDPSSGDVILVESLDHEGCRSHTLTVKVAHRTNLINLATVVVRSQDTNDFRPQFSAKSYETKVFESVAVGSSVMQLLAFDRDTGENGRVAYSIVSGNGDGYFAVDSVSGMITVAKGLDLKNSEHQLAVKAEDHGHPSLSDTVSIRVVVIMSPLSAPKFRQDVYSIEVPENTRPGVLLVTVAADCTSGALYSFGNGSQGKERYFRLSPNTGSIYLEEPLNHDKVKSINLTVVAASMRGPQAMAVVRVIVTDSNTHAPVFKEPIYRGLVQENLPVGTVVLLDTSELAESLNGRRKSMPRHLIVSASDADSGSNAIVTYSILNSWASKYFTVDYGTGAIRTRLPLDYEGTKHFRFEVMASDLGMPSLSAYVPALVEITVTDVNDEKPIFERSEYQASVILPTFAGVKVVQVAATDLDSADSLTYSLPADKNSQAALAVFAIDGKTGQISIGRSVTADTKIEKMYKLEVHVSDGQFSDKTTVYVSSPTETKSHSLRFSEREYRVSILENYTTPDKDVLTLHAVGSRLGEHLVYSLLNDNPWFTVNPISGIVGTTGVTLDREDNFGPERVLVAQVRDRHNHIAQTLIRVTVQDINDCRPEFVGEPYYAIVTVDAQSGTNVTTVSAIDRDAGFNGQVKYSFVGKAKSHRLFAIDPDSGVIRLTEMDDWSDLLKQNSEFDLKVMATDQGSPTYSSETSVKIKVVNKAMPVFDRSIYKLSMSENSTVGVPLLTVKASSAVGGVPVYFVVEGDSESKFDTDPSSGTIFLNHPVDLEVQSSYSLVVRAMDLKTSVYSDVTVEITLEDVNDCHPTFSNGTYVALVAEDTAIGSAVFTAFATDSDRGDNSRISYSLEAVTKTINSDGLDHFQINPTTGVVSVTKSLDYEKAQSYQMRLVAQDAGFPSLSSSALLTVQIVDANDNSPMFTQVSYDAEISDAVKVGHFVTLVSATDEDISSQGLLMFSILDGNEENLFYVEPKVGIISVAKTLKPQDQERHLVLNVSVSDGVFTAHCRVNVVVIPSELRIPKFDSRQLHARINENMAANTLVTTVKAHGVEPLSYSFGHSSNLPFRIEAANGQIYTRFPLDYEQQSDYSLPLVVRDKTGQVGFARVTITVQNLNDNIPSFIAKQLRFAIAANTGKGTVLTALKATDKDLGDQVEYSLYKDGASEELRKFFGVDRVTGDLRVKHDLKAVSGRVFQFFAQATDQGNPPLRAEIPVEIAVIPQSEPVPKFEQRDFQFSVSEATPVDGRIGQVTALCTGDPPIVYAIVPSPGVFDAASRFRVEPDGSIYTTEELDRESLASILFYVTATVESAAGQLSQKTTIAMVTVQLEDVNDNAPVFDAAYTELQVSEDAPVGSSVTIVSARDADTGAAGEIHFAINHPANVQEEFPFKIDSETGWIVVEKPLDREITSSYSFSVVAFDRGTPSLSTTTQVKVEVGDTNDQPPVFSAEKYTFNVSELAKVGSPVGFVATSDKDLPPLNEVSYFVVDGDVGPFSILPTGEIILAQRLDFEQKSSYILTVLAFDGVQSSTATVFVHVDNGNDEIPVCSRSRLWLNVSEDVRVGQQFDILSVRDRDTYESGLQFTLEADDSDGDFTIEPAKGTIVVSNHLDREEKSEYNMMVRASDAGGLFCETKIHITVVDVNDNPPKFTRSDYHLQVLENSEEDVSFVVVRAKDPDLGAGGKVQYRLTGGYEDTFAVHPITGALRILKPLDREAMDKYNITVVAYDLGEPSLSSEASVLITVLDKNDNPPQFTRTLYEVGVKEDLSVGNALVTVTATSKDIGENAKISYKILSNERFFHIDEDTGLITLAKQLDYESQTLHVISVEASDHGVPRLTTTTQVNVAVQDVNDNTPHFVQKSFSAKVPEDLSLESKIIQLSAHDLDSGAFGKKQFRMLTKAAESLFAVDSDGWLILKSPLDRERKSKYHLNVQVHDGGVPPLSDECVISIDVTDVNDNPPVFHNDCDNQTAVVKEGSHVGLSKLIQLKVTDDDTAANGPPFHYRLIGKGAEKFRVTADGMIEARQNLLHKDQSLYELTVIATDQGRPTMSAECSVRVQVVEESKYPPKLLPARVEMTSYLDEFPGGLMARISATDEDPLDKLHYGLIHSGRSREYFSIDSADGTLLALMGLAAGNYKLNVSATDGKFVSYETVSVQVQLITEDMLESSVSMVLAGVDPVQFVETYREKFLRALSKVLNVQSERIVIISIQTTDSTETQRSGRHHGKGRKTRSEPVKFGSTSVLLAVEKGRSGYQKPNVIRSRLETRISEISNLVGVEVVAVITEMCKVSSCMKGDCQERITLDDVNVESIVTSSGISFVAPRHERTYACACQEGYGGDKCNIPVNECSHQPCKGEKLCVPNAAGYSCVCPDGKSGENCEKPCSGQSCGKEFSFNGKGYVKYNLVSSFAMRLELTLEIRTTAQNGVIMFAGGRVDYNMLEVSNGHIRYRFDCGSGEGLVQILDVKINDGSWHSLRVGRLNNRTRLTLDDKFVAEGVSPGGFRVLNLDNDDMYFGAEVRRQPTLHGYDDIRYGFVGCLRNVQIDSFYLPTAKPGLQLQNVELQCQDIMVTGVCASQPCKNFGTCVPQGDSFRCDCHQRFSGRLCELDLDQCASSPCHNSATCENMYNDFFCQCVEGFTGKTCRERGETNHCSNSPCRNGGECIRLPGSFMCNCTFGWTGQFCKDQEKPHNIESSEWGITWLEIIGIAAVLILMLLLAICLVFLCRRHNRKSFNKKRYHLAKENRNNEMFMDHPPPHMRNELVYNNSKAIMNGAPPPRPPRQFGQRGSKLSNLESALSTGIPTVQVRPLSFSGPDRADDDIMPNNNLLECARNYGSAAEELEDLSRELMQTFGKTSAIQPQFGSSKDSSQSERPRGLVLPGVAKGSTIQSFSDSSVSDSLMNPRSEKFQNALNNMGMDSIDRLKAAAKANDQKRQQQQRQNYKAPPPPEFMGSIQCLAEDDPTLGYQWDYTDWSTLGHPGYGTMGRSQDILSEAEDGALPHGVSQLESDSEYVGDSCVENEMEEEMGRDVVSSLPSFTEQVLALQRLTQARDEGHEYDMPPLSPKGEKPPPPPPIRAIQRRSTRDDDDDEEIPEIVPMKPLANYQKHLDRYLPKHLIPPASNKSERRRLLSPEAKDPLSPSSGEENNEGSDLEEEGEYELGSGLKSSKTAVIRPSTSAPLSQLLRDDKPKQREKAYVQPYGFPLPTRGVNRFKADNNTTGSAEGLGKTSIGYPGSLSSFRDDPMTSSYEPATTEPNSSNPSVGDIAGLCELEDVEELELNDNHTGVATDRFDSNRNGDGSAEGSPLADRKQTQV